MTTYTPTPEVADIHTAFARKENLLVEAGAGTGKTTLITKGHHLLPSSTLFLAFNKSIADELAARLPGRTCKTFHALCLNIISSRVGRLKVNAYKYKNAARDAGHPREVCNAIDDLIQMFQLDAQGARMCMDELTLDMFMNFIGDEYLAIDPPEGYTPEQVLAAAWSVFMDSYYAPLKEVSFSDMLWYAVHLAVKNKWYLKEWDCVVVDEAQDVSPIRLDLIERLGKRVIAVGDRRQAIYAFAGAMNNSMDQIQRRFKAESYPLSITWRCDTEVIDLANSVFGETFLKPRPDAGAGQVYWKKQADILSENLTDSDMVVCRTNAPLIGIALKMFQSGQRFNLISDYPQQLSKLAQRLAEGHRGMAAFKTQVHDWYAEKEETIQSKGILARLADQRDALLIVADFVQKPDDVAKELEALMTCTVGPKLCTGHKAKGLEAERVYILRPDLIPAPWIDPDSLEEMKQEMNLKYVMITRARHALIFLEPEAI